MRSKSHQEVSQQVCGQFHDKFCDEVKIVDYGDASVDMVPRMADHSLWQPFGILRLSWLACTQSRCLLSRQPICGNYFAICGFNMYQNP